MYFVVNNYYDYTIIIILATISFDVVNLGRSPFLIETYKFLIKTYKIIIETYKILRCIWKQKLYGDKCTNFEFVNNGGPL